MSDTAHMAHALALGRRALGRVWPNPAVGCVIVRDGRIVGRGWTAPGGRPHAEVRALAQAGHLAQGATAYVTLEPCSHHGKTPPCADALVAAGIGRVVVAHPDPDPRVNGQGISRLRSAGIDVVTGVLEDRARQDLQGFLSRVEANRPMVTLKLANSLDGRIATGTGESQWITGPMARRTVHALRATHDAVLVGAGTARADDPSLTVRDLGIDHQPVRVVISRRLDLPKGKLFQTARAVPVWLVHGDDAPTETQTDWKDAGAELVPCELSDARHLDLRHVLKALAERGLTRVFCEGGGALAGSLIDAGCVDHLITMTAGVALGAEGRPSLSAMGIDRLDHAPRFALRDTCDLGGDVMSRWVPA